MRGTHGHSRFTVIMGGPDKSRAMTEKCVIALANHQ
jgi:hypothetical protein